MKAEQFYHQQYTDASAKVHTLSSKLRRLAWYRFFLFVAIFIPISVLGAQWITLILTAVILVAFFLMVKAYLKIEQKKAWFEAIKKIAGDELKALKHDFLHFADGDEFLDTNHFFSYDLDLFGKGSVFQYLNRTVTVGGKKTLAKWIKKPSLEKKQIELYQQAVKELSEQRQWRLDFLANGKLFEENEQMEQEVREWAGMELALPKPGFIKRQIKLLPVITLSGALLWIIEGSSSLFIFMMFLQLLFMFSYWKTITAYFGFFARKTELLIKYKKLICYVADHSFDSVHLQELQARLTDGKFAGKAIDQLASVVKELGYRQNVLVGFILNVTLLWDIRCVYKLWRWHLQYRDNLNVWLDVVAEFDALMSIANLAGNHPEFVFAEINDDDFVFEVSELGHPLLKAEKRICNDLEINGWGKAVVVTGANMAGKSTFLRTVGVNLILARMGAPVCATSMRISPVSLYTNMRTTDSLLKDESYFFAELKRIQGVLEKLQRGERIFVILDEMLKGTNSIDKLNGSRALVRKLVEFKSAALIATHDLKLSEMADELPDKVTNRCFEIKIENEELIFDYKLTEGVTKTMNATFLMKRMGII